MTSKYKKDDVINKYPNRYGNPVKFDGHTYYLTEHPTLQLDKLTSTKTHLYYSACAVGEDELIQSVPDNNGSVLLTDNELIWEIHDYYLNSRGWFYNSEFDEKEEGKKTLIRVEDACDWENPSRVIKY